MPQWVKEPVVKADTEVHFSRSHSVEGENQLLQAVFWSTTVIASIVPIPDTE